MKKISIILLIPLIFTSCTAGLSNILTDSPVLTNSTVTDYYDNYYSNHFWFIGIAVWLLFSIDFFSNMINDDKGNDNDKKGNYKLNNFEINFIMTLLLLVIILIKLSINNFDFDAPIVLLENHISNNFLLFLVVLAILSIISGIIYYFVLFTTKVLTVIRYILYTWQLIELILLLYVKGMPE